MAKPARLTLSPPDASLIETPRGSGSLTKPFIRLTTSRGDFVDVLARDEPSNSVVTVPQMSSNRFRTSLGNVIRVRTPITTIAAKIATNDKRPCRATSGLCCLDRRLREAWIVRRGAREVLDSDLSFKRACRSFGNGGERDLGTLETAVPALPAS